MRNEKTIATIALVALLVAVLVAAPAGLSRTAPAVSGAGAVNGATRSLEVGFGIELGEDWISLNGVIQLDGGAGQEHVLRIGAFPNVIRQAQKGYALVRALRRAAGCVVKQVLREWAANGADKEGR